MNAHDTLGNFVQRYMRFQKRLEPALQRRSGSPAGAGQNSDSGIEHCPDTAVHESVLLWLPVIVRLRLLMVMVWVIAVT